jgi:murein L,D-transpeptidase YafK
MKYLFTHFLLFTILLLGAISLFYLYGKNIWMPYLQNHFPRETITEKHNHTKECKPCPSFECNLTHVGPLNSKILKQYCPKCPECPVCPKPEKLTSKEKLFRHLADSEFIRYPKKLTLIGLKYEKVLEVWGEERGKQHLIVTYPFTAFSGILGPKFKEGDRQIPEGIYGISHLNPKSKFHLSMRVTYPNAFDKKMAKKEKRTNLGGDIMIHGSNRTIGCIPIGDDKIEELYFLVEKVGMQHVKVILSPIDFRKTTVNITKKNKHPWLKELYAEIKKEMKSYQP